MCPPNGPGWLRSRAATAQIWRIPVAAQPVTWVNGFVTTARVGRGIVSGRRYRLAQRRKAIGLSQERLAETLGVDRSTVVRWERADTDPQPWHRPRLAAALKVSIEDLGELLADLAEPPARLDERLDYVLRQPTKVDLIAVAGLRQQVQRLDERYERVPSTLLLAEAGQLYGQADFLLKQAGGGPVRHELAATVVESATLVGQLVWDASQRRDHHAVAYFDQAIAAARQVRDVVAEANALLRKSYVALYGTSNPHAGLALAHRAAVTSQHDSQVIAGLAHLHVAEAHAMLGDAHRCSDALGDAETDFANIRPDDPADVLFCPSHHGRLAGSCWLFLGKPAKAESILDATRQLTTARRKSTAIVYGNLALAGVRQRKMDTAVARLHEAIGVVEQTRSGGGLNVVCAVVRELQPWRTEQAVQEVKDRLLTVMTAA
jgi:transcriptional regulator with XRE-family HTH domain